MENGAMKMVSVVLVTFYDGDNLKMLVAESLWWWFFHNISKLSSTKRLQYSLLKIDVPDEIFAFSANVKVLYIAKFK